MRGTPFSKGNFENEPRLQTWESPINFVQFHFYLFNFNNNFIISQMFHHSSHHHHVIISTRVLICQIEPRASTSWYVAFCIHKSW
jgi:hypothetical protein